MIAIMEYGDVRSVKLEVDRLTELRTLSWYVESDLGLWEKQTLVLKPGETHPMIEMWKMALANEGDDLPADVFDRQAAGRRKAADFSRRSARARADCSAKSIERKRERSDRTARRVDQSARISASKRARQVLDDVRRRFVDRHDDVRDSSANVPRAREPRYAAGAGENPRQPREREQT